MRPHYPIALDLTGRRILIVGAGPVAMRKARGVLEAGASDIAVVAPRLPTDMPAGVRAYERPFVNTDLDGIDLCLAATNDPAVNSEIVRLCRERRILCNRADRDENAPGDFSVPAIHRDGPLMIAVSASGSPRLAAAVRDSIAETLDPAWAAMGETALKLRERIVSDITIPMPRRKMILHAISSPEALATYKQGGESALIALLADEFPELKGDR